MVLKTRKLHIPFFFLPSSNRWVPHHIATRGDFTNSCEPFFLASSSWWVPRHMPPLEILQSHPWGFYKFLQTILFALEQSVGARSHCHPWGFYTFLRTTRKCISGPYCTLFIRFPSGMYPGKLRHTNSCKTVRRWKFRPHLVLLIRFPSGMYTSKYQIPFLFWFIWHLYGSGPNAHSVPSLNHRLLPQVGGRNTDSTLAI